MVEIEGVYIISVASRILEKIWRGEGSWESLVESFEGLAGGDLRPFGHPRGTHGNFSRARNEGGASLRAGVRRVGLCEK